MKIPQISIYLLTLSLFLMMLPPTSSTLYSISPNLTISYQRSYQQLAYATYSSSSYQKGWNFLHITASSQHGLTEQHRGAGYLQGYITYRDIYSAYRNLVNTKIQGEALKIQAQQFVDAQLQYLEHMVQNYPRDLYWQYVGAYLEQVRYMYRGYLARINVQKVAIMYMGWSQFYFLTNAGDLLEIIPAFSGKATMQEHKNCNGYVKLLNNSLYIGHSTHNHYQYMLRTYKTYHFPSTNVNVGSQYLAFSSRPGDINSKDDFYVLGSGLVIMESSFDNYNVENYKDLSPKTVPCWLRVTVASNLARSGSQWVDYFLKARSGTHNNQWLVIDPSKLKSLKEVVTVVQEGFSEYHVEDVTKMLQEKGYVATYNVPITGSKIFNKLGYEKYGFTYETDPRAKEYQKYDKLIENVDDMKKWLLDNANQNTKIGIAPRYDLASENASAFGLTDLKIITPETLANNYVWAYSGPSTSNGRFKPFQWTNWPKISHEGMPNKWNFQWQKYTILQEQVPLPTSVPLLISS